MAEGSFMSIVKEKKEQFFFTMNLVGSGAEIPDSPSKSSKTTKKSLSPVKAKKSFIQKNGDCAGSLPNIKGDPIGESIGERKTAGSPL